MQTKAYQGMYCHLVDICVLLACIGCVLSLEILTLFQCDKLEPACSQCKRAGKACTGYRDQLSLLFRDENDKVIRKARTPGTGSVIGKRKAPRKPKGLSKISTASPASTPSSSGESLMLIDSASSSSSEQLTPLAPPMPVAFDDLGINFFFHHYVTVISDSAKLGHDPTIGRMWANGFTDRTFYDAVSSVGFAGLSNVTKDRNHMTMARKKYVITLGRISAALQNLDSNDLGNTFKAVLLLAAFEVMNSPRIPFKQF